MKKTIFIAIVLISIWNIASAQYEFHINAGKFIMADGTSVSAYTGINNSKSKDPRYMHGLYYYNNSENTDQKNQGAIPTGTYYITGISSSKGPNTIILRADEANVMYSRDNFRIHGDNTSNNASQGCIILNASARQSIANAFYTRSENDLILTLFVYE